MDSESLDKTPLTRRKAEELAQSLATPAGLRKLRRRQQAIGKEGEGGDEPARRLQVGLARALSSALDSQAPPRPISIWQPRQTESGLVFERPEPGPWGDHYAFRRRLLVGKPSGTRRLCFFGESAAAGYLYAPHLTPAMVLEATLNAGTSAGEEPWEVLDLARTDERLGSLAETVLASLQLASDLLVIYTGNNWTLLETPEVSPYWPSVRGRQAVGTALSDGLAGGPGLSPSAVFQPLRRLAQEKLSQRVGQTFEAIAEGAAEAGVSVLLALPPVNLKDWPTVQPPPWLVDSAGSPPGEALAHWHRHFEVGAGALEAGRWNDARDAAETLLKLEGEPALTPTPHVLLGHALLGLGRPQDARQELEAAVEATTYATLACLDSPRAGPRGRQLLQREAHRHGFATVDLARTLEEAEDGAPPGRRFFLDYCHLTHEGMEVTMAAVAQKVAEDSRPEGSLVPRPSSSLSPEAEATAFLGAAVHTAHRLLGVNAAQTRELIRYWCRRALKTSPGIRTAMLELIEARLSPGPGPLTQAQITNLASTYRLTPQHGWLWDYLDPDLLQILLALLEETAANKGDLRALRDLEDRLIRLHGLTSEPRDLSRPPYLWQPLAQLYPDAMAPPSRPRRAYLRSPWPETSFVFVTGGAADAELEIVARLPSAEGNEAVLVLVDGQVAAEIKLGTTWTRARITLPQPSRGMRQLSLRWPVPKVSGETALPEAADRLELGREADLHPIFGEVFALKARQAQPA